MVYRVFVALALLRLSKAADPPGNDATVFLQTDLDLLQGDRIHADGSTTKIDSLDTFESQPRSSLAAPSDSIEKARMDEVVRQSVWQKDAEASTVSVPEGNARAEWFAWDGRIPMVFASDVSKAVNNSDFVNVWTYLGDKWWTEFIDGQFHKDGPHALDYTPESMKWGMDGDFSGHAGNEFDRFSVPHSWDTLWTADEFGQANARYRGTECVDPQCLEMYSSDTWTLLQRLERGWGALSQDDYAQITHDQLDSLFADYYKKVSPLQWEERHIRIQRGFIHLVNLFVDLARLHPFADANSRTRLLAFQTEVVRLGGHPVVLWDLRDDVYAICTRSFGDGGKKNGESLVGKVFKAYDALCGEAERLQFQNLLLDGWCAWEVVATTGESPFRDGTHPRFYDESAASCVSSGAATD
jgi:hypothetical protein